MNLPATRSTHKILLVDDVPANLAVLSGLLEPEGYEILAAASGAVALKIAERANPDLILLDVMMPELDGLETCRLLKASEATCHIPVIFITARQESSSVVEGFSAGCVDYLVKPFQAQETLSRVKTHLRVACLTRDLLETNRTLQARTNELTAEVERRQSAEKALQSADETLSAISTLESGRWNLSGLLGTSPKTRLLLKNIERLHQFPNTSVLITGESGTGKELIARSIHFGSPRSRAAFVPVNCVAIPGELAESMLFGHSKGAFTGAVADRKGFFELAHGGTLFLDEIGDMPASLQVKLLRVLEDGLVTPVGASHARKVDVRIIAATNADLQARIADGRFRQDLFFRLARYQVSTTPLRERNEDVPALALHFLRVFATEMGIKVPVLSAAALEALNSYDFPGNVRELRNIVERALIESNGQAILPAHLHLLQATTAAAPKPIYKPEPTTEFPLNLAEAEDLLIQRALQQTCGNIAEAARLLGVHRTRVYRKLAREEAGSIG
jgi:DNA-binding NtrC family response regulator